MFVIRYIHKVKLAVHNKKYIYFMYKTALVVHDTPSVILEIDSICLKSYGIGLGDYVLVWS